MALALKDKPPKTMQAKELKRLLWLGLLAEALIFIFSQFQSKDIGQTFRLFARYSGRLSLFFFIGMFLIISNIWIERRKSGLKVFQSLSLTFAILHFIHLIYLSINVYLNEIKLIPYRLAGGALGYLFIFIFPIVLRSKKTPAWVDIVYFFYPLIIFALTITSRLNGSFEGSAPSPIHYIELGIILISVLFFIRKQLFAT